MLVMKFGGSSVANVEAIERVGRIILGQSHDPNQICIVFSAFGDTTDLLLHAAQRAEKGNLDYKASLESIRRDHLEIMAHFLPNASYSDCYRHIEDNFEVLGELMHSVYLSRELSDRFKDLILSFGERSSNYILSYVLNEKGFESEYVDARKIIKTDNSFGGARVLIDQSYALIRKHFKSSRNAQIVTGYISSTVDEITTTLGRSGSDYTASLIGGALSAERIEIWTDVDGVMSANPKLVPAAMSLSNLSYMEARELSHFGAKVIFPLTISPAQEKSIPIYVKNSLNPQYPGTKISAPSENGLNNDISGITSIPGLCICTLEGGLDLPTHALAAILFSAIAQENLNLYLITQGSSESSISFAVKDYVASRVKDLVDQAFERELPSSASIKLLVEDCMCAVAIVGEKILLKPGITGRAFSALGKNGINIEATAQGSSERTISFLVNEKDESLAVQCLHQEFFSNNTEDGM